ncbi:MAG: GGDEF domain-containing protein, partial [Thiovulaceae bacterium]|nr:GGDEF domain-containing protein [Sulfurimonadaceae bacterium]
MNKKNRISSIMYFAIIFIFAMILINFSKIQSHLTLMSHDTEIINEIAYIRGAVFQILLNKRDNLNNDHIVVEVNNYMSSIKRYFIDDPLHQSYNTEVDFLRRYNMLQEEWDTFKKLDLSHNKHYSVKLATIANELAIAAQTISQTKHQEFYIFIIIRVIGISIILILLLFIVYRFINKELENEVFIDPLTKLYNRRYLNHYLIDQMAYFERSKEDFSALFIDIDHFKRVNDDFGHKIGDLVLEEIGFCIKTNLRKGDLAFRYGGEEFFILLARCDIVKSREVSNRILTFISQYDFSSKRKITVSIGATQFRDSDT